MAENPKICPFMSTPDKPVACTPVCKLYRNNRPGYECHFQEMQAISWNTKNKASNSQGGNQPPY